VEKPVVFVFHDHMPNIALIQLISEQTMQNLLPILALKPGKAIHLVTEKTASRAEHIIRAYHQSRLYFPSEEVPLSPMPSVQETHCSVVNCIELARSEGFSPVVNFTGGTKLMSIGAYQAALEHQVVSFYIDTDNQIFLDGHTGPELSSVLGADYSFEPFSRSLTVNSIAVANGRQGVTGGLPWKKYLPLAKYLLDHPKEEQAAWESMHGQDGLCPNGREPKNMRGWGDLISKKIEIPETIGLMACEYGILCKKGGAFFLTKPVEGPVPDFEKAFDSMEAQTRMRDHQTSKAIKQSAQFALAFLSGAWWEVIVADFADRCGQFRDLRWSVNIGERFGGFDKEEDIVGVDGVQVAFFSCKRGGLKSRLVPLLDELDNRAKTIGGRFSRRFLAVYLEPMGKNKDHLFKRAKELGIRIITKPDLENLQFFDR